MSEETNKNEEQEEGNIPQYFLIEGGLANGILNYLGSKPYVEVAGLIDGLREIQPISVHKPEEEETEAKAKEKKG